MSENDVKNAIIDYLLYRGALVLRINSGAAIGDADNGKRRFLSFVRWFVPGLTRDEQGRGVSDILGLWQGRWLAIETKAPGKRDNVTAAQARFLEEVRARGGIGIVAESIDDVAGVLK